jgi:RHS repeat-associated protein
VGVLTEGTTPDGVEWNIYYGEMALTSADGTVHPIYHRQDSVSFSVTIGSSVSNVFYGVNHDASAGASPTLSTYYYHGDHLGSTRMITSGFSGFPMSQSTFSPYGAEVPPQITTNHYKFTGKERDSETGLDYFGARYYGSTMGRWMSPDPSNLGVDIYLPRTWNRYNYAVNNPLTIVDRNGLWPFYIHNMIIDESFPGMSKQDFQGLKNASWNMDFDKGQQDPAKAYEHGMSDGTTNQDPTVAKQMADDYISQQVQADQKAQADWEVSGHTGIAFVRQN